MKNPIKFSKKLLIIPLLLCFVLGVSSISLAYIEPDEKILIDSKLTQVYSKTESYSEAKQQRFYKFFIQELSKKISSENR
jgi:hypothetical protein